jgi:hypothetical protein
MRYLARRTGLFAIAIRNKRYQIRRRLPPPLKLQYRIFRHVLKYVIADYFN